MEMVPLEDLRVPQLVKEFTAFYGTRNFVKVLTRADHLFLFWARSVQSTPLSYILDTGFNFILPSTRRYSKSFLSSILFCELFALDVIKISSIPRHLSSSLVNFCVFFVTYARYSYIHAELSC
jgi:hypothetical protein